MNREQLLISVTKRAGQRILSSQSRITTVRYKDALKSVVTDIDVSTERMIRRAIARHFPHDGIIGEELGTTEGTSRYTWIIDPIDGTANYPIGLPLYCTTIALVRDGVVVNATIYDPIHKELYVSKHAAGARLNGKRLPRLTPILCSDAVVAVAFANRKHGERLIGHIVGTVRKTRYLGSTAITLAYCVAGRIQACVLTDVSSWDIAAGTALLREVGGVVRQFDGRALPSRLEQKSYDIIAGNPKTVSGLLRLVK